MISSILPGSLFRLSSGMGMFEIEGEPTCPGIHVVHTEQEACPIDML
jgi:hypothetical protein